MLTVILVVYHSDENKLKYIINQIGKKYKIIIVDNSFSYKFDQINLTKKTKIIRSKNIGNGAGINLALKEIKTKYALYVDIDTKFKKDITKKFLHYASIIKKFAVLVPSKKKKLYSNYISEKYDTEGSIMFFNINELKKVGLFDEKIFLYFEEVDLFLRCKKNNKKVYLLNNYIIKHERASSVKYHSKKKLICLRWWHYMWSMFYVNKKNFGFFYAIKKSYIFLGKDIVLLIFYCFKLDSLNFLIRFNKIYGLISSIIGLKSFKRID